MHVVKEIVTKSAGLKAVISRREDGTLEVTLFSWGAEVVPGIGEIEPPAWRREPTPFTLAGDIEAAEGIAREILRNAGGDTE